MSYAPEQVEYMIPDRQEVVQQLKFFPEIGWFAREHPDSPGDTFVRPRPGVTGEVPQYSYWQTNDPQKMRNFDRNGTPRPSRFAVGYQLPWVHNIVSVTLGVPSNDAVHNLYESGGNTLHAHAERPTTEYGRQVMNVIDPFKYQIKVAAPRSGEYFSPATPDPLQITINLPDDSGRDPNVLTRLRDFYEPSGFNVWQVPELSEIYVSPPPIPGVRSPIITYNLTSDSNVLSRYIFDDTHEKSVYNGLRMPSLYNLVENCWVEPDESAIGKIYKDFNQANPEAVFVHLREHPEGSGSLEFRYGDPFYIAHRFRTPSTLRELQG